MILLLCALGALAGFAAGLLGIGGGVLIVPGLAFVFYAHHLPLSMVMHLAAGTSLCVIIFTALTSSFAHYRRGHVCLSTLKKLLPLVLLGTLLGALLADKLPGKALGLLFGLFLLINGIKLLCPPRKNPSLAADSPTDSSLLLSKKLRWIGILIGFPSGLLGVGGGIFTVPALLYCRLPIRDAVGTSAALTLPISIIGTLSFLYLGLSSVSLPWATGYIYWPAVLCMAPLSMLCAPMGARLAEYLPPKQLRRVFAIFVLLIALYMFWHFIV